MISSADGRSAASGRRRSWAARAAALLLAVSTLPACDDFRYPRDPNDTLERVLATRRVRVAAVDHVPWVVVGEARAPQGIEPELVAAFARQLGATIEWRRAPAFEALQALARGDVDLAIGGFTKQAVTAHKGVGQTYVYFTEELVVAADPGAPVPEKLNGQKVYVAPELMANRLVEEKGGIPVSEKTESVRLVAVPSWQIPVRGLVPTGIVLRRSKRVMAIAQGENAWLMRLEQFLRRQTMDMAATLRRHAS